jgi:activator-of-BECN1-regulated-autophagy protein 1
LIGYGVREPHVEDTTDESDSAHPPYHPVTAMYKVNKGGTMRHISTMLSGDDDVNIARFHPDSGYGFVYGTKQGRIRILGPRPWNYYNC